ncbi:MAG: MFS transporter [Anaerolineae bacterium]
MNSIALLTVIIVLVYAAIGVSGPLFTLYLQALGANYSRIAVILATAATVTLISSYAWGRFSDRLGRRKPLVVGGLLGGAVAYLLLSRALSFEAAWVVRLFEAALLAAYSTASLAFMGDLLAGQGSRGRRMGIYRGAGSLAFAGGALIGGRLADATSLRVPFLTAAGLYALAGLIALALHEATRPAHEQKAHSDHSSTLRRLRSAVIRRPSFSLRAALPLPFLVGVFLWQMTWNGQASMWPNYMASLGYAKTAISSLWGWAGLIEAPAMLLTGRLSDLFGRAILLAAGGIGAGLVMLGYLLLAGALATLLVVQVGRGIAFGSYTANAMTFAVEFGGEETRGANSGLLNTASSAGQLVGLYLGGTIVQLWGFQAMWTAFAVTAMLSAVCFLALRHRA